MKTFNHRLKKASSNLLLIFAVVFFVLGVFSIDLPLIPTTPLFLLFLFFASQGSLVFGFWVKNHPFLMGLFFIFYCFILISVRPA